MHPVTILLTYYYVPGAVVLLPALPKMLQLFKHSICQFHQNPLKTVLYFLIFKFSMKV
ncbi:MAG: hypothetical protein JWP37_3906 [Mucilaginibacter sp.]|nr:hypothetical protein [Mucilaginibacter sp.]